MGCFLRFKDKFKHKKQPKPSPISGATSEDSTAQKHTLSKSSGSLSSPRSISCLYEERGHILRVFEYRELRNATNGFSGLLKLGEGGFGCVYKGVVRPPGGKGDHISVAVKKLTPNGLQGHKQWLAEVQFLGIVEHPNLVKLIGYCAVDGEKSTQRLLVYEFMPNKSLEDHLFNRAYSPLPWNTRLQIVLGAAEGLAYLHEGLEVQVIYRDFKASNVLLDEEFKPKLSDFGLAREGPTDGNTHVSTAVMGTYGYAAPDYIETGHLTDKSDVWSFGVVLYEILTGRRCTDRSRPAHEQKLLDWVKHYPADSKKFSKIMDPRLENQYPMRAAREMAKLADSCLSKYARDRPKMREVVESIKQAMQYEEMEEAAVEDDDVETDSEKDRKQETTGSTESTRRRMLHLEKLRESANAVGRRRLFTVMRASDRRPA